MAWLDNSCSPYDLSSCSSLVWLSLRVGWTPVGWKQKTLGLLRPRIGSHAASLLIHSVGQNKSQGEPRLREEDIGPTSWWEEQHTGTKMGRIIGGHFCKQSTTPSCSSIYPSLFKWSCKQVLPGGTQVLARPWLPPFSQSHWLFLLFVFFCPLSTMCLFIVTPHAHLGWENGGHSFQAYYPKLVLLQHIFKGNTLTRQFLRPWWNDIRDSKENMGTSRRS